MKAAILYGKEEVRVEEVKVPALLPGQVRISIEAALTCGTDLKVFKRGYHAKMIVPPAAFGHELAGTISEISQSRAGVSPAPGDETTPAPSRSRDTRDACPAFSVGDRVVVANSAPC